MDILEFLDCYGDIDKLAGHEVNGINAIGLFEYIYIGLEIEPEPLTESLVHEAIQHLKELS